MNPRPRRILASLLLTSAPSIVFVACAGSAPPTAAQPCVASAVASTPIVVSAPIVASASASLLPPTPAEAVRFVDEAEAELLRLTVAEQRAGWVKETNITLDTDAILAAASEETMAFRVHVSHEAARFDGVALPPETARKLLLLKTRISVPAPSDAHLRAELAAIDVGLQSTYGEGKYCATAAEAPAIKWHLAHDESAKKKAPAKDEKVCLDLDTLDAILGRARDEAVLRDAWKGWHAIAKPMRPKYQRFVELANLGAKEIGYADLGALWRAGYDMTPAEFEADTDRLWREVKPLYDELHCFARKRLRKVYGKDVVGDHAPIPAHLLGNMWAQEWDTIYDVFEPYKGEGSIDVTKALEKKKVDEQGMVKLGERFYTRLGFDPLPKTFWERSLFRRPDDREVECHASAWDVVFHDDLRIKMCVHPTEADLLTIHHELGHDYYFHSYYTLPFLFQDGANDGFHEAIGDTMALSVTPPYLKSMGLLDTLPKTSKGLINVQMKRALDK
ncbi:MAG: M2 family metallopeptidase, partial [Polyangiales bacterium]